MAPIQFRRSSVEDETETIPSAHTFHRRPTLWFSFLSCFWFTSISSWLTGWLQQESDTKITDHVHDDKIKTRKPIKELNVQTTCLANNKPPPDTEKITCERVDEMEVEEHYQWVIKTLKDESLGNAKRRYCLLIKELWNLVFQSERNDEFLEALIERFFPTSKGITEKSHLFDLTKETDSTHLVEKPIKNTTETKNNKARQDDVLLSSQSYTWQKLNETNETGTGTKKQESQSYGQYENEEIDHKKTRENATPLNDPVGKLDKNPKVVVIPGDRKNGCDPNIKGETSEPSSSTNSGKNQHQQSRYNGIAKQHGEKGDDGDQPNQGNTDITKGHYEENPMPFTCMADKLKLETNICGAESSETQSNGCTRSELQLSPDSIAVMSNERTVSPLSDFKSLRQIGKGAFGICDLGFSTKSKSFLVRKKVRREYFDKNEIKLWKKLCPSPFIILLYGVIEDKDHVSMFMEPMDGTLQDIVDKREVLSLSEKDITALIKQVLSGLAFIHEKRIVHCDIKCQNIFYNENSFQIKLGDFGVSVPLNEMSRVPNLQLRGTLNYMSYEMCKNKSFGRSTDIWSVGCVVIHLLTGRLPWPGYEMCQIIYKVGSGRTPEIPNTCSPALKETLEMMLRPEKTERPTARELLNDPVFKVDLDSQLMDLFGRMLELKVIANVDSTHQSIIEDGNNNEVVFGSHETPMSLSGSHHANVLGENQAIAGDVMGVTEGTNKNGVNIFQPQEMFSCEEID